MSVGQKDPRTKPQDKTSRTNPWRKSLWLLSINQSNLFNEFSKCNYHYSMIIFVNPASTYSMIFSSIRLHFYFFINPASTYTMIFSSIQLPLTLWYFDQSNFHLHYNFFTNPASNEAMTFHQSSFHLRYDFSSIQLPLTRNPTAYTLNQSKF